MATTKPANKGWTPFRAGPIDGFWHRIDSSTVALQPYFDSPKGGVVEGKLPAGIPTPKRDFEFQVDGGWVQIEGETGRIRGKGMGGIVIVFESVI